MKKLLILITSILSINLYGQRFYTDYSMHSDPDAYSTSTPELINGFRDYIPLHERVDLRNEIDSITPEGDTIIRIKTFDDYDQTYQQGILRNNKREGIWNYYFFGENSGGDRSNKDAFRSKAFFVNDCLHELIGSANQIRIVATDGLSPKLSTKVIDLFEDLELRSPYYVTVLGEDISKLESAAITVLKELLASEDCNVDLFQYRHDVIQEETTIRNGKVDETVFYKLRLDGLSNKISIESKKTYKNDILIHMEAYPEYEDITYVSTYYQDGTRQSEGKLDKDKMKTGKWKSYYPNGNIFEKGNFNKGKKVGKWRRYDQEGNLVSKEDKDNHA